MKAERLPSGKWRVRVYLGKENGKARWKSITAKTKDEALREAALFTPTLASDVTVEEACEQFIKLRQEELSPSTLRGYTGTLSRVRQDVIGAIKLDKLSSKILQEWVNGIKASKKTKKNHLGFVLAVARFFEVEKVFRVKIAQEEKKELHTPTMGEVNQVLGCADDELKRAILLACFGLRRGEICALTATDFDRKKNTVRISKAFAKTTDNTFVLKSPKTMKSARVVPLPSKVIEMMPEEGRVISCSPDCITNRFAHAVARAGVPKFRFHDLRSFFASTALSTVGSASRSVQDLGGWQTDRVMKSHYERSMSDQFKKDSDAIIRYFSDHLKTE